MISEFSKSVQYLGQMLTRVKAANINSEVTKSLIVDNAKEYFGMYRPYINENNLGEDFIARLDGIFQELLHLVQENSEKHLYIELIKEIKSLMPDLLMQDLLLVKADKIIGKEGVILSTLESIVATAALSYKQVLIDLTFCNHKVSFRGTASELRETLRETLDHLALDKDVMAESGFKLEKDQTRPTMRQKVRFILRKRGLNDTRRRPSEIITDLIDELIGQLARAIYNRASLSTHLETTKAEVIQIKKYVDLILQEILEIN